MATKQTIGPKRPDKAGRGGGTGAAGRMGPMPGGTSGRAERGPGDGKSKGKSSAAPGRKR